MLKAHASEIPVGPAGSGIATPGVAKWLHFAATPTFAIVALWNAFCSAQPDVICTAMHDSSAMGGMTFMYLLMSVFHLSPWLTLIRGR